MSVKCIDHLTSSKREKPGSRGDREKRHERGKGMIKRILFPYLSVPSCLFLEIFLSVWKSPICSPIVLHPRMAREITAQCFPSQMETVHMALVSSSASLSDPPLPVSASTWRTAQAAKARVFFCRGVCVFCVYVTVRNGKWG